jgi:wobble nucleotide-excising tRNase
MRALKSITKIKDCPSFLDFRPNTTLPDFGKHNLIYGWNGSGKTTLSRILRSFELGKNYFDDPANPSQFELKLDDGTSINNENLSGYNEVRVFNKDFVDDSVFCASGPKPLFYLGKESKESKEKITEEEANLVSLHKDLTTKALSLEKTNENKEKALSVKARDIKNALTTTKQDKYRNYDKTSIETSIRSNATKLENPSVLTLSEEKLETTQKAIQQTSKEKITQIASSSFDISTEVSETATLVNKVITSQVIESLKSDEEVSKWVEHGLGIHKDKALVNCAFCDQVIPASRLTALENHFNLEYQKTLDEIKILRDTLHAKKLTITFPDSSSFYDDLSAEYILEKSKAELFVDGYNSNVDALLTALDQKQNNLFKKPSLPTLKVLSAEPFKLVNEIIAKHNLKTDNFETQISSDKESLELHFLAGFIYLHNETIKLCNTLDTEHKALIVSVREKTDEIRKLKEGLISHHIPAQKINEDLEKFLGRADIQIKATDSQDGYQITRNGIVAKNLSEGEETALAVVYFLAKIKEDGFDIKNGTIVIDDPVSSLDSNSIFLAFSFIKESIKEAGQIIILTHHFDFFRQVKNWFQYMAKRPHNETCSYFMTVCKSDAGVRKSNLIKLDKLLLDFESEYHFIFNILYCFSKKSQEELSEIYSLPNTARKFLESFLAFRVPITVGVTNIDARLTHIDFDSVKKTRINRFVQTHSHPRYEAGIQDFDMSLLAEAPEVVADLLDMVKKEDERHYNHLVKSVDPGVVQI